MKTANVQTKAQSKAKQSVKQSKETAKVSKQEAKQSPKFTYIVEGLSGKQLMNKKSEQNKDAKRQLRTISSCITAILDSKGSYLSSFVRFDRSDITPKNLLPLRTEAEKALTDEKGFSTWIVLGLIKRFYGIKK